MVQRPLWIFLIGVEIVIFSGNIFFVKLALKNPGGGESFITVFVIQMVMKSYSITQNILICGLASVPGIGITLLRSTLLGKNGTLLRSTLLKRVVFDQIENSTLLKIVVVREIERSTVLKIIVV